MPMTTIPASINSNRPGQQLAPEPLIGLLITLKERIMMSKVLCENGQMGFEIQKGERWLKQYASMFPAPFSIGSCP